MTERVHAWFAAGAVLVLVVGILGWRSVSSAASRPAVAVPNPGLAPLAPYVAPAADTLAVHAPLDESIVLRRDPFASQSLSRIVADVQPVTSDSVVETEQPKWNVSAILIGGTRRAAIINDELVHVGDTLPGGMKLTSVERDRVVLTDSRGTAHTIAVREGEGQS